VKIQNFATSAIGACQDNFICGEVADCLEIYLKSQDFDTFFGIDLPMYSVGVYGVNFHRYNKDQNVIWAISNGKVLEHTKTLL
jgi:hypothetical protein